MASSPVAELESILQEMLQLKPPGVSGSKISRTTKLCADNVKVVMWLPDPRRRTRRPEAMIN